MLDRTAARVIVRYTCAANCCFPTAGQPKRSKPRRGTIMFERISRGMQLTKQSLQVLRDEKSLIVFPILSGICCMLVLGTFAGPLWATGYLEGVLDDGKLANDPIAYALLFAYYFVNYFVIVYFNSALVSCAIIRFHGDDPTVTDGLKAATARLPQIAGWAAVSATVGLILKAIESRSEKVGQFVAGLLGGAWSIATYFVVPVLVVEGVGPIEAVKRSFAILRKSWGESLVANFSIGLAVMLASLVSVIPAVLGFVIGTPVTIAAGIAVTVVLLIAISLVAAALNTIIIAALYLYAAEGRAPRQFDEELLRSAYRKK
jgi:hypothetical protein